MVCFHHLLLPLIFAALCDGRRTWTESAPEVPIAGETLTMTESSFVPINKTIDEETHSDENRISSKSRSCFPSPYDWERDLLIRLVTMRQLIRSHASRIQTASETLVYVHRLIDAKNLHETERTRSSSLSFAEKLVEKMAEDVLGAQSSQWKRSECCFGEATATCARINE